MPGLVLPKETVKDVEVTAVIVEFVTLAAEAFEPVTVTRCPTAKPPVPDGIEYVKVYV